MHSIEPYYNWRDFYIASEDEQSVFYGNQYSEFEFTNVCYNYLLHPQWENFGSATLFLKTIYVDYDESFAVIELIGEWNDCISNDVMILKREILDPMILQGIKRFVLIGENVLNFHFEEDSYYEELFDDIEDGWVVGLNFKEHVLKEFKDNNIDYFMYFDGNEEDPLDWRIFEPQQFFELVNSRMERRLNGSFDSIYQLKPA
ncbi:MAG: hypothetical protein ACJAZ3_001425 [Sphingobacteriales bacterium]|jgi:hypothetical protein